MSIREFIYDQEEVYSRLIKIPQTEKEKLLDPICEAVWGKVEFHPGIEVKANRVFALMVLDLYEKWQREVYEGDDD